MKHLINLKDRIEHFCTKPFQKNPKRAAFWLLLHTYLLFSAARFLMSLLLTVPPIQGDELVYKGMALSFFKQGDFYTLPYGLDLYGPNYLYTWLISFGFYFKDSFYVAMKAINAFTIHLVLFPVYWLLREFTDHCRAFWWSALILTMPFANMSAFIMPESLYYPFFWVLFYSVYKLFAHKRWKYVMYSAGSFGVLFLIKPHILAFLLSFLAMSVLLLFFKNPAAGERRTLAAMTMVTLIGFVFTVIGLNLIFRGEIGGSNFLFNYGRVADNLVTKNPLETLFSKPFFILAANHFVAFAFVYLIPFAVTVFLLIRFVKEKRNNQFIFLLLGLGVFCGFLGLSFKFSIDIAPAEKLLRIHSRYYASVYPFFIMAFGLFFQQLRLRPWHKVTVGVLTMFTVAGNVFLFLPLLSVEGAKGGPADNCDTAWIRYLVQFPGFKYLFVVLLGLLMAVVFYYIWKGKQRAPYVLLFLVIMICANGAYLNIHHSTSRRLDIVKVSRDYVADQLPSFQDKVFMVGAYRQVVCGVGFWLPYNYTRIRILPKGHVIKPWHLKDNPKWVVLFGHYQIGEVESQLELYSRKGWCYIFRYIPTVTPTVTPPVSSQTETAD